MGSIKAELQDAAGGPVPGLSLADCREIFGDKLDGVVKWKGNADVSALAGKTVRLDFHMSDADLYAFRFQTT